jgi:hypothetical protein
MDWGSMPDWFAAIGTVGALAVALVLLRGELQAQRRREQAERRAQAEKVAVWLEDIHAERTKVVLLNTSNLPIYGATVWVTGRFDDSGPEGHPHHEYGVVPPGTVEVELPTRSEGEAVPEGGYRAAVEFGDARSVWWQRIPGGDLREIRRTVRG